MSSLRKYVVVFKLYFQKLSEYRAYFFLGIVNSVITNLLLLLFWSSLAGSGANLGPYTSTTFVHYYLLAALIASTIGASSEDIAQEIKNGTISVYLVKPVDFLLVKFLSKLPAKLITFSIGSMVLIVVLIFTNMFGNFGPRAGVFFVFLLLSILGNYLLYFVVGLSAFWIQETHGLTSFVSMGSRLVAGNIIPLDLLPAVFVSISYLFPFRYFYFLPIRAFLGLASQNEIATGLMLECEWIISLYILARLIWRFGIKRLEVIGI